MANGNSFVPTADVLDKFTQEVCKDKKSLERTLEARKTDLMAQKDVVQRYKICALVKAEKTNELYRLVDYQAAIKAVKESKLIQEKVKSMGEMYKNLDRKYTDLVKKIQDTKKKMKDTVEAAEKLERCIDEEERCNPGLFQLLGEISIDTSGEPYDSTNPPVNGEVGIWTYVNTRIMTHSKDCYEKLLDAFDASIEIAGFLTFINIDSLKAGADKIAELALNFKKDIDANTKTSAAALDSASKELATTMDDVVAARFEKCAAATQAAGAEATHSWLCASECPEDGKAVLTYVCNEINKICNTEGSDEDDDCGC